MLHGKGELRVQMELRLLITDLKMGRSSRYAQHPQGSLRVEKGGGRGKEMRQWKQGWSYAV